MGEKEEVDSKVQQAIEAAVNVYAGEAKWHAWAESWLSKNDRTSQAAVRAASLIPGVEEFFFVFEEAVQRSIELEAHGHDASSEACDNSVAELVGLYERILPRSVDPEAARPRAAADSAFRSALSAFFAGMGSSDETLNCAKTCAETSLWISELLDEEGNEP